MPFEAFYANIELQSVMISHQEMVEVKVTDANYKILTPNLGGHYLAENDGDDVKIINCNL